MQAPLTEVRVGSKIDVFLLFLNNTLISASPKGKALPSYLNFILHY